MSGGKQPTPQQRSFQICKDHQNADWNQPTFEDGACILCRLFYLEAQESLLEEWQQRAKRAEDTIAEIERPLDAQMARLNATVERLNHENEKLRTPLSEKVAFAAPTHEEIAAYRDLFRSELDKNMHNSSGSPSTDAHTVALHAFVEARNRASTTSAELALPLPKVIGPVTEMVQEISALCGSMEGTESNCEVVSCVLNAAKRYLGGERGE